MQSLREAIDSTTSGSKLVFHLFGALAGFERNLIRERTAAGLSAARLRGRIGGRPPALSEADKAMAAALMRDPSITMTQIAKQLGSAPSTLHHQFPGGRAALVAQTRCLGAASGLPHRPIDNRQWKCNGQQSGGQRIKRRSVRGAVLPCRYCE